MGLSIWYNILFIQVRLHTPPYLTQKKPLIQESGAQSSYRPELMYYKPGRGGGGYRGLFIMNIYNYVYIDLYPRCIIIIYYYSTVI